MSGVQRQKRGWWTARTPLLAGVIALAPQAGRTQLAPLPVLRVRRTTGAATPPAVSTLLAKARPVARFGSKENWFIHQWLSADSLLMVHAEKDAPHVEAEIVSASTQVHRPLAGLNRFLDHVGATDILSCEVSSDGHWFLEHDKMGTNVMRMDGSQRRYIDDEGLGVSVAWLPDSKHWLNYFTSIGRHGPEYSQIWRSSLHPGKQAARVLDKGLDENFTSEEVIALCYAGEDALLCYAAPVHQTEGAEVEDHHATRLVVRRRPSLSAKKSRRASGFMLPHSGMVLEAAFSPTRRRLAWSLWSSGRLTFYTSALNGANRTVIGSFACTCPQWRLGIHNNGEFPVGLGWLPNGRSLSFVYRGTVYTVSAA